MNVRRIAKMSKDKDYKYLITTNEWKMLRREKLMNSPYCSRCEREGRGKVAADCVHHIIPVESGANFNKKRELCFNYLNLQSLCHKCHWKTHKEMGSRRGKFRGSGYLSKVATKKKNEMDLENFKRKFFGDTGKGATDEEAEGGL